MNKPLVRFLSFLAAVACSTALAPAQTGPTVEERLKALEQQVQTLAQENAGLKQQLGWKDAIAPVLPQPGGREARLIVGGLLQAQAEFGRASDPRWNGIKDRFFFRRARIYLAGSFAEDFDFKAELDLQGNSLNAGTGLNARANDVFINWHKYDFANLRFGQLKPAYGAEALANDSKILTIERSLVSERLADSRQLAAGVAGDLFGKKASYLALVANGSGANVSANDNSSFQKSIHLTFTPIATAQAKLILGASGLWARDTGVFKSDFGFTGNLFAGRREMSGVDAEWTHGPLDLSAEWLHGTFRPVGAIPAARFSAEGWHAKAAYFLIPARLQAVVRHEEFDPNTSLGSTTIRTFTFGLNYLLKGDDLKFKLNYLDGRVPGSLTDGARLLARVQVIF